MEWWYWIVAALVLFALEALTPGGFFMFFFGAGALLVGALAGMGILGGVLGQVLAFSFGSIGLLLLFRRQLVASLRLGTREIDSFVGTTGVLLEDLAPGAVAKVEVRGAAWNARTDGPPLARGQRSRVVRVDGLTFWVVAD